jgi:hypothetical protein
MSIETIMRMLSGAAASECQPDMSFASLARAFSIEPGYILFSVSRLENGTCLRRIFSTDIVRHPPDATKDMAGTGYCAAVIERRSHLLSMTPADLRANFQDHEAIIADGVGSALNLCLEYDGRVVGSANFLGAPGAYDPATLHYLTTFQFPLALLVAHAACPAPALQNQRGLT